APWSRAACSRDSRARRPSLPALRVRSREWPTGRYRAPRRACAPPAPSAAAHRVTRTLSFNGGRRRFALGRRARSFAHRRVRGHPRRPRPLGRPDGHLLRGRLPLRRGVPAAVGAHAGCTRLEHGEHLTARDGRAVAYLDFFYYSVTWSGNFQNYL